MLKRFLSYGIALCLAFASVVVPLAALADEVASEYAVKAVMITKFIPFIEWPDGLAISKQSHIDVCTIGDGGLNDEGGVFQAASTSSLSLSLTGESDIHAIAGHCHILFIARSEEAHLKNILAALKDKPVLTVSDINHFAQRGGMIGFVIEDNRTKLVINPRSASAASLNINAQLLALPIVTVVGR